MICFLYILEQSEPVSKMDTSDTDVVEPTPVEETPVNGVEESTTEEKSAGKRKRSTKKTVENDEATISNGRPRRTLPKRKLLLFFSLYIY